MSQRRARAEAWAAPRPRRAVQLAFEALLMSLAAGEVTYRESVVGFTPLFLTFVEAMMLNPELEPLVGEVFKEGVLRAWCMRHRELPEPQLVAVRGPWDVYEELKAALREGVRKKLVSAGKHNPSREEVESEVEYEASHLVFVASISTFRRLGELR